MTERHPNTATPGFVSVEWFDTQLEEALSLLGAQRGQLQSYGARSVRPGDPESPLILSFSLRDGCRYQFYNFEEMTLVAGVTTPDEMAENEARLKFLFG